MSLEDGSRHLCRSIANQTVQNVKIKYGDDASDTTHHALFAAGHGTLAAAQLWDLGPRSVAGRMARKAGIQMLTTINGRKNVVEEAPKVEEEEEEEAGNNITSEVKPENEEEMETEEFEDPEQKQKKTGI